jgi:hypothetical protein
MPFPLRPLVTVGATNDGSAEFEQPGQDDRVSCEAYSRDLSSREGKDGDFFSWQFQDQ